MKELASKIVITHKHRLLANLKRAFISLRKLHN